MLKEGGSKKYRYWSGNKILSRLFLRLNISRFTKDKRSIRMIDYARDIFVQQKSFYFHFILFYRFILWLLSPRSGPQNFYDSKHGYSCCNRSGPHEIYLQGSIRARYIRISRSKKNLPSGEIKSRFKLVSRRETR